MGVMSLPLVIGNSGDICIVANAKAGKCWIVPESWEKLTLQYNVQDSCSLASDIVAVKKRSRIQNDSCILTMKKQIH